MKKQVKLCLVTSALAAALSVNMWATGFEQKNTYADGQFTDVPTAEWYASEVKSTYELGLMNGIGGGLFNPEGNVTVAEAITMASRACAINKGVEIPAAEGEWYQMYVNFAIANGFVKEGQFDNFDRPAKRYEVASLFENAMPEGYFTAKNQVAEIPDVDKSLAYEADLMNLYKAGVVMGSDSYGNFRPEDNITRAESAAIISRVAIPEKRLQKTLDTVANDDAYTLVYNNSYTGSKEGINSGWRLDNRGGIPRIDIEGGYGSLADISKDAGTAMIRELNKVTTGLINLETTVSFGGNYNGFYLEYKNEAGDTVYKLALEDDAWSIQNPDGSFTKLVDKKEAKNFTFNIDVDLDNCRSTTSINGALLGTHPLCVTGDDANLYNFRFATTEESTAVASLGLINITANYAVNDDFDFHKNGTIPYEWTGYNAENKAGELYVNKDGLAIRAFNPVSGTVVSRFETRLSSGQALTYEMKSGAKTIVSFTSDETNLYANGTKVYENYSHDIWYRFSVDVRTLDNEADIWVNGRKIATVELLEKTTSIDNITFANASEDIIPVERVKVFEKINHDDYVPVPVKPAGEEDHIVGMNICSLWRNGTHFGWSCVSAYDDTEFVLGYYDEGSPESADWEIKYMVEHGIDFQAFCWYADHNDYYIKDPRNFEQLYNGYMYSEYSDMMKYCLIWEAANAAAPSSLDSFKKYYVPYFVENFFKDDRYMTIENKPVLCMFGASTWSKRIGGDPKVKECFDYLEEEVKKLGFDGMIYLSCGSSSQALANMGFDGCYAYNWGTNGYSLDVNKSSILNSANNGALYTVPTISVGFNSIPWHGIRYPMMTPEDFEAGHQWIIDEYLPKYAKEDWQKNFSMISTWNEYGEGTYIMPSSGNGGFGYLDALRTVYTDEEPDASLNTVPTEKQLERINHLFPQYRKLLRKQGYYKPKSGTVTLETVKEFDFTNEAGIHLAETKGEFTAEGLKGIVQGDARITLYDVSVEAKDASHFTIEIAAPKNTGVDVFFITDVDKTWNSSKRFSFRTDSDGLNEYVLDMSTVSGWRGTVTQIRIDPGQSNRGEDGNEYTILKAALKNNTSRTGNILKIDDVELKMSIIPELTDDGTYLIAFDPKIGLEFALDCFHTWDASDKRLTLEFVDHTLVFTEGSDKYLLDGKEMPLGYTMYLVDGLPMIPIEKICKYNGYKYESVKNSAPAIYTDNYDYYTKLNSIEKGKWEFETPGFNEHWNSSHMSLITSDGSLTMTTSMQTNDPIMTLSGGFMEPAEKYTAFEIKCRYKYDVETPQSITIYYTTSEVGSMRESTTIRARLNSNDSKGEWETYTVDLTELADWRGTILQLRFDPFNSTGTMEIDYMRFIEDPDYVEEKKEDEKLNLSANGDSGVGKFYSNNANISIINDPDNESNKVFLVEAKDDGTKYWTYFRHEVQYTAGKKYQIEFDVKPISIGKKTDAAGDISINVNLRFYQGATVDHVVGGVKTSIGSDWTHFSLEYEMPADSKRGADQFAIYANPVGDDSVSYMLDNISIKEIE